MPNYLSDLANSFNRSVTEPVGNMLSNLSMPIRNQWAQGEPNRIASGALMMGDPATAKQVIEQRFANTTPQDIYQGSVDAGLGMAPMGVMSVKPVNLPISAITQYQQLAQDAANKLDAARAGLTPEQRLIGVPDNANFPRLMTDAENSFANYERSMGR